MLDEALACEQAALDWDQQIENSEGASVSTHETLGVYGNSLEFLAENRKTRHGISCSVIGRGEGGMQRDYWYSASRKVDDLDDVGQIGRTAGSRVVRRLGAKRLKTCQAPVLFEAPVASSLLSHFIGAISGGALYRKASFLLDQLGKPIFPEFVFEINFLVRVIFPDSINTLSASVIGCSVLFSYFPHQSISTAIPILDRKSDV